MKELSLHVYDLMENSIAAKASLIELTIIDSLKDNIYSFMIKDNGKGMSQLCSPRSPVSSMPAVSIRLHLPIPGISILFLTGSVVVPGVSETMAVS